MNSPCVPVAVAAGEPRHRPARSSWDLPGRLSTTAPADAIVLFASPGDSLPDEVAAALYAMARHGHLTMPVEVVLHASQPLDVVRAHVKDVLERRGPIDRDALARVMRALRPADIGAGSTGQRPLYYFAHPATQLAALLDRMRHTGSTRGARVLLDKPFGHDLRTARALNHLLDQVAAERDIYRVDHHLPEHAVQQILAFRQAHAFVEPLWDRHHVESVQITMADAGGVEDGARYKRTGAIRDVVQSELLHLVASVAMDVPCRTDPDRVRDGRAQLIRCIRAAAPADLLRGRFCGCRDEPQASGSCSVETYAALRLAIDSERWTGVPFHVRTGKRLPVTATEITVRLRATAGATGARPHDGGYFRFRCAPTSSIEVVSPAFSRRQSEQTAEYGDGERPRTVARCVLEDIFTDAVRGNTARFARRDYIEDAWRIVTPLLDDESPVYGYAAGSWGPAPVNPSIAPAGGWINPQGARGASNTLFRSEQAARR